MEIDKTLKNFTDETLKKFKLSRWKKKRDRYGQPIRNDKDYYQPDINAAFAIEHCYDPKNWICKNQCRGRCLEGKGGVLAGTIKRLIGKSHTGKDLKPKLVV